MKKSNSRKSAPAPARVSTGSGFTNQQRSAHSCARGRATANDRLSRSAWQALQREAKAREMTVGAVLQERGSQRTERISIEVPSAFVELLRYELGDFGTSPSRLAQNIANALLGLDVEEYCEQLSNTVHKNHNAAYQIAVSIFVRNAARESIALRFFNHGKVQHEIFVNPLRHFNAA